jgi:hypothetical protein
METWDFQAPAQPKPINRSIWNFALLIMSARLCQKGLESVCLGDPAGRWNITWKFFITILYLTLPFFTFFNSCMCLQPKRLDRFTRTMTQTTRFAVSSAFWGSHWYKITFRVQNSQKTPNFWTRMPNFQSNQYIRINFERWEIDEIFQRTA